MSAPSHRTKFGRDVVVAGIATLTRSLRNLLLLPLLTHAISLSDFGVWEQIAVGIAILVPWVSLHLPGALLRVLAGQQDVRQVQEGFYSVLFFVFLYGAFFAAACWLAAQYLSAYPGLQPFMLYSDAILLVLPLTVLNNVALAFFRTFRLMLRHSLLILFQNFGEILLITYLLDRGGGVLGALLALAVIRGLTLAAGLAMVVARIGFRWPRFRVLGPYLRFGLPLVPQSWFYRVFDAGDRYILSYCIGSVAVGLYTAAYTAGTLFSTLISPLNLVLLPLMAELWNSQRISPQGNLVGSTLSA